MTEIIPAYLLDDDETTEVQALIDSEMAIDPDGPTPDNRWQIDGINTAEWAMRHVRGATKQIDGIHEQAEAFRAELRDRLRRVDEWEEQVSKTPRRTVDFFTYHLESYAHEVRRESDGRIKTLTLPSGKVTTREASGPVVEIADHDALLGWFKRNTSDLVQELVIKTTEKVLISEARPYLRIAPASDYGPEVVVDADGQPVPGVTIKHPQITAKVVPE